MDMKITIEKLKFERPKETPKDTKLELNIDWSIEYKKVDKNSLNYTCKLKTETEFPIVFTIEGTIEFENNLNNSLQDVSQYILDNMAQILMNMIFLTKDKHVKLENVSQVVEISAQNIAS